jgi:hypothetical protein
LLRYRRAYTTSRGLMDRYDRQPDQSGGHDIDVYLHHGPYRATIRCTTSGRASAASLLVHTIESFVFDDEVQSMMKDGALHGDAIDLETLSITLRDADGGTLVVSRGFDHYVIGARVVTWTPKASPR